MDITYTCYKNQGPPAEGKNNPPQILANRYLSTSLKIKETWAETHSYKFSQFVEIILHHGVNFFFYVSSTLCKFTQYITPHKKRCNWNTGYKDCLFIVILLDVHCSGLVAPLRPSILS